MTDSHGVSQTTFLKWHPEVVGNLVGEAHDLIGRDESHTANSFIEAGHSSNPGRDSMIST